MRQAGVSERGRRIEAVRQRKGSHRTVTSRSLSQRGSGSERGPTGERQARTGLLSHAYRGVRRRESTNGANYQEIVHPGRESLVIGRKNIRIVLNTAMKCVNIQHSRQMWPCCQVLSAIACYS